LKIAGEIVIKIWSQKKILRIAKCFPGTQLGFEEQFNFRVYIEKTIINKPAAKLIFGLTKTKRWIDNE